MLSTHSDNFPSYPVYICALPQPCSPICKLQAPQYHRLKKATTAFTLQTFTISYPTLLFRIDMSPLWNAVFNAPQVVEQSSPYLQLLRPEQLAGSPAHRPQTQHTPHQRASTRQREDPQPVARLPISADCPICLDTMDPSSDELNWCTHGCGNSWHQVCIDRWADSKGGASEEGRDVRCPLCRVQVHGPFGDGVESNWRSARGEVGERRWYLSDLEAYFSRGL